VLAFAPVSMITLTVDGVGSWGATHLAGDLEDVGGIRLPGVLGLQIVTEAQTAIRLAEAWKKVGAEEATGIGQVNKAVTQMDAVTQQNAAQTEEFQAQAGQFRVSAAGPESRAASPEHRVLRAEHGATRGKVVPLKERGKAVHAPRPTPHALRPRAATGTDGGPALRHVEGISATSSLDARPPIGLVDERCG
jgi:hypothetical protein